MPVLTLLFFALAMNSASNNNTPFQSSEVQFTDASRGGLAIVPASCPSSPHYGGDCSPSGYVDSFTNASCFAWGWAHYNDGSGQYSDTAVDVDFYIDGPPGVGISAGRVKADKYRADLCATVGCYHAFEYTLPAQFKDGLSHTLYVYAIDPTGWEINTELSGSRMTIQCSLQPTCPDPLESAPSTVNAYRAGSGVSTKRADKNTSPICVSNSSGNSYFVPANTPTEIESFKNSVRGGQLPGASYTDI